MNQLWLSYLDFAFGNKVKYKNNNNISRLSSIYTFNFESVIEDKK